MTEDDKKIADEIKEHIEKQKKKPAINEYGDFTIGKLITCLQLFIKEGLCTKDTKVFLSDFECNGKQTKFEVGLCEGYDELYLWYEMNESLWE